MVEAFGDDDSVGAVSCRVHEARRDATITELRIIYPSGTLYVPWDRKIGMQEIDCPSGQAFMVRKKVFRSVGGFDPDYFAYYDEVDLGWRIRLRGYKVVYSPDANIIHKGSHSFAKLPAFVPTFLSERNRMLACVKNLGASSLAGFVLAEMFNLTYRSFRGMLSREWRPADSGYVLAFFDFLRKMSGAIASRSLIQRSRKRTDREIFSGSLPQVIEPHSQKELIFRCVLDIISRALPAR
jgi:GT2 family glycosyltransferase